MHPSVLDMPLHSIFLKLILKLASSIVTLALCIVAWAAIAGLITITLMGIGKTYKKFKVVRIVLLVIAIICGLIVALDTVRKIIAPTEYELEDSMETRGW